MFRAELLEDRLDETGDVLEALAKRRDMRADLREPEEEVATPS